jgi:hypothetical protein
MPYLAYIKTDRYNDVITLANATLEEQGGRNVEETYLYKGHALAALGDIFGAKNAYLSALGVNENFYPAQWALDWINSIGGSAAPGATETPPVTETPSTEGEGETES